MARQSIDGKSSTVDVMQQRIAAGTIGGSHIMPQGVSGNAFNQIISPFDTRASIHFGTWTLESAKNSFDFLGQRAWTSTVGAYMEVVFTGNSIAIIGQTSVDGGRANITIDGEAVLGKVNTTTTLNVNTYFTSGDRVLGSSATSIEVNDASSFTSSGFIIIDGEEIEYSGISTNTFTGCTRGANGTTAATHGANSTVTQINSAIEMYSLYQQDRIILWSKNNLEVGQHKLRITLRADSELSLPTTIMYINGFIQGGIVGAASINTSLRYIQTDPYESDASGVSPTIQLAPANTNSQLLSILSCFPVLNCNWAFAMYDGSDGIKVVTDTTSTANTQVLITLLVLEPGI